MSNRMNGQWRLKSRPVGMVKESDFEYVQEPVPELGPGELLIRNLYLAFEPAMRGWLNDVKSYVPPVQLGEVMRASTVGQVVESNNPDYAPGDFVSLSGGTIAAWGDASRSDHDIAATIESTVADLCTEHKDHDDGPFLAACYAAESFLSTWQDELPFGRPLAP